MAPDAARTLVRAGIVLALATLAVVSGLVNGPSSATAAAPRIAPAAVDESLLVPIALAPISDAALIAWVGSPEPMTKVTLQQALTAAPNGETVHILPGAYQFSTLLTSATAITMTSTGTTQIFGRLTTGGGALTTSNVVLSPAAASTSVLTVTTASGAVLTDIQIANPDGFAGSAQIGINLANSAGATVTGATISGMTTGIAVAAANTGAGPMVSGGTIRFRTKGIGLGATVSPVVSGTVLIGPTGSGTMGIDYGASTAAAITGVTITGVLAGISTAGSTAAGPQITGGSIEATGNAINLAATTGARVTGTTVTCLVPTNNAAAVAVNVNLASDVVVQDITASGFATGVGVANASTATGIGVIRGDISAVTTAIALGTATGPTVSGTTVRGQERAGVVATTGVNVLNATGALVENLTSVGPRKGIAVAATNTSAGLRILGGTFTVPDGSSTVAIELGGVMAPVVDGVAITGTSRSGSRYGIHTVRAQGAVISDATITTVGQGITGTWLRLGGTPLTGHEITGARISDVGIGIYTANTDGTTVDDAVIDAYSEGVAGHEDANFTLTDATITGHAGSGSASSGTNCVRFYYTRGIVVTDVTTTGGSTGLYLDMSYGAVATRLDVSGATWYGTYAESITGFLLQDSQLHDNAGIANLTINPSALDALDVRQVSSDIVFEDSVFTDNLAGVYLPLGAFDFTFQRNVVTGTHTFVVYAAPAHQVLVADNRIAYTHDASLLDDAFDLADLPSLGDPLPEPPFESTPPPDIEEAGFLASLTLPWRLLPMSSIPPATPAAAIWMAPTWYNLDTTSASSDDIAVLRNIFTGDGPFVGVGTVSVLDRGTADAPSNPSAMRTVRDTIEVSLNVFPQDSTAIVTVANAEVGTDADTSNEMINGNAAVDARGDNDWGSRCYARAPTDLYDGGGAFIHEVLRTQVLYPQGCQALPDTGADSGAWVGSLGWSAALLASGIAMLVTQHIRRRDLAATLSVGSRADQWSG